MSASETKVETPDNLMVELEVPVLVRMIGYAKIRVPIDASPEKIDEALDEVNNIEQLRKFEQDDERDGESSWKEQKSKYLHRLTAIGRAFRQLDKQNIAPTTDQCCNTDASCRVQELLTESRYIGFAAIHAQHIEDLLEHGKCHVSFGARDDDRDANIAIGQKVLAALVASKFEIKWDGNPSNNLEIIDYYGPTPKRGGLAGRFNI